MAQESSLGSNAGAGSGHQPQYAQASLPSLPQHLQSDTHLTAHLASRFHAHLPTAQLSSHGYVALNTYTSSTKGPNGVEEGSAMAAARDVAARAWTRLGHRSENQAVVFMGESGSGKTTIRSHLLSSLLSFSSTPLSNKLSYAAFVFDSLTTTKSVTTPTASKSGLFFELQYDTTASTMPTLVGGKVLDHRLERSRVASVPTGERNFHILYYLLAGTSAPEKTHLGLDSPGAVVNEPGARSSLTAGGQKRWRYLGHASQLRVGINDHEGFQHFKTALRKLEFPRSDIAEICQVLAAVLHVGQLDFAKTQATTPAADESGGYSHEGGQDVTTVRNKDVLGIVAAFLGVGTQDLEVSLGHKSKTIHRERVTVMLDPRGARANADELARTLYALLVAYVIEQVNQRICAPEDAIANTVSIVDFPGFVPVSATGSVVDQLLNNSAQESLYNFCLQTFFERQADMLDTEDVSVPATSYFDNSEATRALLKPGNGVLAILDDQMRRGKTDAQFVEALRKRFEGKNGSIAISAATTTLPGTNFKTVNEHPTFTISHFAGEVEYSAEGLLEENGEVISGDLLNLIGSTRSDFIRELFGQEALNRVHHPKEKTAIMQASVSSKPMRMPSMARRKTERAGRSLLARPSVRGGGLGGGADTDDDGTTTRSGDEGNRSVSRNRRAGHKDAGSGQGAAAQFLSSLHAITKSLGAPNTNAYFFFCLKPNDRRIANQFDSKCVRTQMQTFGLAEVSQRLRLADFSVFLPFSEFLGLAEAGAAGADSAAAAVVGSEREKADLVVDERRWPDNEARVGATGVFLSERAWFDVADVPPDGVLGQAAGGRVGGYPRGAAAAAADSDEFLSPEAARGGGPYSESRLRLMGAGAGSNGNSQQSSPGAFYHDDKAGGYFGSRELDAKSDAGASAFRDGDMFRNLETRAQMAEKGNELKMETVDESPVSGSRKRWLFLVWLLTFYVPDFLVRLVGKMPRKDIRIAWREKFAINLLIWLSCAFVVFFMIGMPELICPTQHVYSQSELSSYDGKDGNSGYVAIRGIVYDLDAFVPAHYPAIVPADDLMDYAGRDATNLFPVQVSALCNGKDGSIDPAVQLSYKNNNYTDSDTLVSSTDTNAKYHDFRWATNDSRPDWWYEQQMYLKANYMKGRIGYSPQYLKTLADKQNYIAIINERVYDFTTYIPGGRAPQYPDGTDPPDEMPDSNFMDSSVVDLFQQRSGEDVTKYWNALNMSPELRANMQGCLDFLFYVGDVDTRNSAQCLFAKYILLAISILLVSVIGFKFLAALQFGKKNMPENLDKFVICTVPAYTEDEESLRRAIDSAARMRYDDKRKLLVIICDGMIIGQGNDRPTPRIVLDILGVSETVDPEPLSFESLGEGMKQHNMGKVYSGLYEVQGHIVPFLVVVKVGKPSEVTRPGNRGKRDSQMILMRFLNRVHYNLPMTPLELEMHHQIRNIIGVNPTFYEFCLQIDADTVVAPDSATRMVAAFLHDTRLIGVCGETALTNAKSSVTTMIQVYEYYISHNLTKAFESLFGSVTCLPGCFSMYRIRAAETGKPLFVSKEVVDAYAEIRVDTLHMKNLLHLGEDRYLTTLLLKFHSKYKTKYIFRAHAWTIAPDSWKVFMSQRRRWINSTVHNLIELIPLQQLCGFCCFSMRFVVFLDLLSTVVQPVIVGYIVYLIVLLARSSDVVPITAFILLGAIYGLQAVIFILRRKWEMIGWMIIYIIATPVFACGLPLYAFWHMDDFSWGNTRVVTGEKGQKIVVSDEGKFDPNSIPRKKWEEYQAELWDAQTQRDVDTRSEVSGFSYATKSFAGLGAAPGLAPGGPPSEYGFPPSRPMSQLDLPRYGSRLSLAPSGYGGYNNNNNNSHGGSEMEMADMMQGLPSDDALLAEIREILKTADLMTVTKKSIKNELERRFGVALDVKRQYIGSATEAILSGQL
ncbi:chitin synthase-domain-containing protein [Lineolata rhizophorae]|uniref:chitin synthase n=1 Tax=Lineolata rhizophorae TaxID=578093 RepID=A0A6A6NXH9_9PEZI|nr:chitin synthase-domain-containing protein [Lineolata rhizophorae]